jgi:gamma-aminobutyric acid receptor subunit alpha
LTIKAACPMSLENFPMDVQRCPLKLGSCKISKFHSIHFILIQIVHNLVGYTTKDIVYRWNSRSVAISDDLRMSQFDLIDVPSSNESFTLRLGDERHGKQTSEGG